MGELKGIRKPHHRKQMQALGPTLATLHQWVRERLPVSLTTDTHLFKPGNAVWVKERNIQPLKPLWKGPFTVISPTSTAVKVAEVAPCIQQSKSSISRLGVHSWSLDTVQADHSEETDCYPRDPRRLQPCFSHSESCLIYAWQKLEESAAHQDKQTFFFFFFFFVFCLFLGLHPRHMEVPRLGVESELLLPAYTTATAMPDPSRIFDLHHSSQQHLILNPLSEARDWTHNLVVRSQIRFLCATMGTP